MLPFNLPSGFGDDHFGAQVVEFLPQIFGLQMALNRFQLLAIARALQLWSSLHAGDRTVEALA